jgi:non-ribosomal peptide synthetase component F
LGARFAAQVAARPNADAVVWGGTRLTYAALAARVYPLANYLRAQGVGPDVRVGRAANYCTA